MLFCFQAIRRFSPLLLEIFPIDSDHASGRTAKWLVFHPPGEIPAFWERDANEIPKLGMFKDEKCLGMGMNPSKMKTPLFTQHVTNQKWKCDMNPGRKGVSKKIDGQR